MDEPNVLELTIDTPQNRKWYFPPLKRIIRGRFRLDRMAEPTALSHRNRIPEDVAGQTIGVDLKAREGYIVEPLHQDMKFLQWLEKTPRKLGPERESFPNIDVDEWLYYLKLAVDSGKATLLKGEFPKSINYIPPTRPFETKPKRGDDRKREIFNSDPRVAAEYIGMDEKQRKEWESLVGV